MSSTAVVFFSVCAAWIFCKCSVFGQDICDNIEEYIPAVIPYNYPTYWYPPFNDYLSPSSPTVTIFKRTSTEDDSPTFRIAQPSFQPQKKPRVLDGFLSALGYDSSYYSVGEDYRNSWPQFVNPVPMNMPAENPYSYTYGEFWYPPMENYQNPSSPTIMQHTPDYQIPSSPTMQHTQDYQIPSVPTIIEHPQELPIPVDHDDHRKSQPAEEPLKPIEQENLRKSYPAGVINEDNHPNWQYFDREACGESLSDRIIGGTEASLGQYPWLAILGFRNGSDPMSKTTFSCGGALINTCWVLTAAHCIEDLPKGYYVSTIRLGEHNLETRVDCNSEQCADPVQDFIPVQFIPHEKFNTPKLKNDIALIKLNYPVQYSRWVQPICLPYANIINEDLSSKIGEVAGWGVENIETLKTSSILQTIKLPVRTLDSCRKIYKSKAHIDDNQYCVGGAIGFDSCNGDSGGPFMKVSVVNGDTPKYFIHGVVSFGAAKCGKKPTPGVYTRLTKYLTWVLDHVTQC